MFKIIRHSKIWFIISSLISLIAIAAISYFGLRVGIDYRGGTVMEIESNNPERITVANTVLSDRGFSGVQVKESGDQEIIMRLPALSTDDHQALISALKEKLGDATETRYDTVGPTIGKDLTRKSILAVTLASLAIIIYIAYAFRKLPKPLSSWAFGASAVVALIHDLLITTGAVAIFGHYFVWMEVDVLFITALLTIMGFSVHDTIVVYDRLRENFIKNPHRDITLSTDESINQTLVRSINTSLTVIIVLVALLILGGSAIRHFITTLTIGMFVGTYSSIFVAPPLVVAWHKNKFRATSKARVSHKLQRA